MPTSNEPTTGPSMSYTRAICIDTGLPIGNHVVRQSKLRLLKQLQDHVSRMQMLLVERTEELRSEILSGAKIQRGSCAGIQILAA